MNTEYTPISHFEEGQSYSQTFMVRDVKARVTTSGRRSTYLIMTVQDVTGRLKGFVWDVNANELRGHVQVGSFVHMTAECSTQKWGLGFSATSVTPVPRPDDLSNFVYGPTAHQLSVYADDIREMVDSIDDHDYRNVVCHAIEGDVHLIEHILTPMAYGRNSYAGGLLIHTRRLMKLSLAMIDALHDAELKVDRSLIIAGALFRNIGYYSLVAPSGDTWDDNPDTKGLIDVRQQSGLMVANLCQSAESDLKITIPEAKKLALRGIAVGRDETVSPLMEIRIIVQANKAIDNLVPFRRNDSRYTRHQA